MAPLAQPHDRRHHRVSAGRCSARPPAVADGRHRHRHGGASPARGGPRRLPTAPSRASRTRSDVDDDHRGRGALQALPHRPAPVGLRDAARLAVARGPAAHAGRSTGSTYEEIWALKDVSFSVEQGEVLGVIGRNGAGKSTLLKLLTRITTPTAGEAVIRGRVGSLLEVGTGFHPELTGRENVYLNGAILGMRRREITRKLPRDRRLRRRGDVHRHAGQAVLERHVRAARVLGGGPPRARDPARGRGARGRRRRVPEALPRADGGVQPRRAARCVFVSHQMQALARLCDRAILLDEGKVVRDGSSDEVVALLPPVGRRHAVAARVARPRDRTGRTSARGCARSESSTSTAS